MVESKSCCASSPAAIAYWFAVSLVTWGILSLVGFYWRPLRAEAAQTILLAAAAGCFSNWVKNRTYHCIITGPVFLILAVLLLVREAHLVNTDYYGLVWPTVLVATGIAFLVEWRHVGHRL